jgi:hypothetical protein
VLHFVSNFKYLGHRIVNNNTDDADIQREVSNLFCSYEYNDTSFL